MNDSASKEKDTDDSTSKVETTKDEALKALGATEMTDLSVPGDASLASGYSQDEIEEARKDAAEIVELSKNVGRAVFLLAEKAVYFRNKDMYLRLGFESFRDWYAREHYAVSTIYRYMEVYEELTYVRKLPVGRYAELDIGKAQALDGLLAAKATDDNVDTALDVVNRLSMEDWLSWIKQSTINLRAGLPMEAPPRTAVGKSSTGDLIPVGYYILTRVPKKDIGKADPGMNGGLVPLKGIKTKYRKDTKTGELYVEVLP